MARMVGRWPGGGGDNGSSTSRTKVPRHHNPRAAVGKPGEMADPGLDPLVAEKTTAGKRLLAASPPPPESRKRKKNLPAFTEDAPEPKEAI